MELLYLALFGIAPTSDFCISILYIRPSESATSISILTDFVKSTFIAFSVFTSRTSISSFCRIIRNNSFAHFLSSKKTRMKSLSINLYFAIPFRILSRISSLLFLLPMCQPSFCGILVLYHSFSEIAIYLSNFYKNKHSYFNLNVFTIHLITTKNASHFFYEKRFLLFSVFFYQSCILLFRYRHYRTVSEWVGSIKPLLRSNYTAVQILCQERFIALIRGKCIH